jgi:hypothetical protein
VVVSQCEATRSFGVLGTKTEDEKRKTEQRQIVDSFYCVGDAQGGGCLCASLFVNEGVVSAW